jgi:hypothetical protein
LKKPFSFLGRRDFLKNHRAAGFRTCKAFLLFKGKRAAPPRRNSKGADSRQISPSVCRKSLRRLVDKKKISVYNYTA